MQIPADEGPLNPQLGPRWSQMFKDLTGLMKYNSASRMANPVCELVFGEGQTMPLQRKRELASVLRMLKPEKMDVVMEIGGDTAGTFFHWLNYLDSSRACCIEIRGVPYAQPFHDYFGPDRDLLFIDEPSGDCVEEVEEWLANPKQGRLDRLKKLDMLFIDGAKDQMYLDWTRYAHLVRPGGIIMIHDILTPTCGAQFDKVAQRYDKVARIIDTSEGLTHEQLPPSRYKEWLPQWLTNACGFGIVQVP